MAAFTKLENYRWVLGLEIVLPLPAGQKLKLTAVGAQWLVVDRAGVRAADLMSVPASFGCRRASHLMMAAEAGGPQASWRVVREIGGIRNSAVLQEQRPQGAR